MARELDLVLDRHLAHRFNVFRYLRTDELGLSRVIADLLDPGVGHFAGWVERLEGLATAVSNRADRGLRPSSNKPAWQRPTTRVGPQPGAPFTLS